MKIAYIMSRFPNLTETFVLYEIISLERQLVATSVYPLLRMRQPVTHPEAKEVTERAHYQPFISIAILGANLRFLFTRPRAYLGALFEVLRGTWGSTNFFIGAVGIFPKAVRFAQEIREEGVTHIHAHFANHPTVAALVIHRLTGIPFSFTAHGHDIHVERRMLREKIAASAFAVMISSYNRDLILDDCPGVDPEKLHIIHCGADTRLFTPGHGDSSESRFTILCLGSFIEVKGHQYLVRACQQLRERGIDFVCHLVGGGPDRSLVEAQIADAGIADAVRIHGPQPRPRVAELMGIASVIVQPSVPTKRGAREGIPVSLMEGMASGLPVVASRISGIPELVDDGVNGILVEPRDAHAMAAALERLAQHPDLRVAMGRSGREKVLRDFDLDRNAMRLVKLIENVAGSAQQ